MIIGDSAVDGLTRRQEWAGMWPLPLISMMGVMGQAIFIFSSGVFLSEMTQSFGWSRAEFSSGFTIQMLVVLVCSPVIGSLVDRYGSRKMALIGIIPFALTFSLLGFANGSIWQWRALCVLQGIGASCIASVIWVSAVVARFHTSRGLALAVVLAGYGLAASLAPVFASLLVRQLGWRAAFPALSLSWALLMWPLVFYYFIARSSGPAPKNVALPTDQHSGRRLEVVRILFSKTFLCLIIGGGLFASISVGVSVHSVPILMGNGFGLAGAASIAGVAGFATLLGRLGTGLLLDHFDPRRIGIIAFLVPVLVAVLLLNGKNSAPLSIGALIIFGLAAGAESDLVTYMASRLLPPSMFGSVYSVIISIFAVCSSLGPLLAGYLYDATGSYDAYLLVVMPMVAAGAFLIFLMPSFPSTFVHRAHVEG